MKKPNFVAYQRIRKLEAGLDGGVVSHVVSHVVSWATALPPCTKPSLHIQSLDMKNWPKSLSSRQSGAQCSALIILTAESEQQTHPTDQVLHSQIVHLTARLVLALPS